MTEIGKKENLWGYGKRLRSILDAIAKAFPDRSPSEISVLDVGCGNASELGIHLAQFGLDYTGIDLHEPSISAARHIAAHLPNARFECVKVEELSGGPFDVVILSEVLEHLETPLDLLRNSLVHIAEDGIVIVTVPNGYGEFEWDSMIFRMSGLAWAADKLSRRRITEDEARASGSTENAEDGHVQFFTLGALGAMFRECSLEIIDRRALSFVSGPIVKQTLGRSKRFVEWNARIADRLPMAASSGWLFVLRPIE